MDCFEKLTGFRERNYEDTRAKLSVEGSRLRSLVNSKSYEIGQLELVSLQTLRERTKPGAELPGRLTVSVARGDVRKMHQASEYAGAMFQVASQFNLLEMIGPKFTPEDGVTIYQNDPTQGPACAIAAGAATIYRNYCAPVSGSRGQTKSRQFDGLADLGNKLSSALGQPVQTLWTMQNGYALCTPAGALSSNYLPTIAHMPLCNGELVFHGSSEEAQGISCPPWRPPSNRGPFAAGLHVSLHPMSAMLRVRTREHNQPTFSRWPWTRSPVTVMDHRREHYCVSQPPTPEDKAAVGDDKKVARSAGASLCKIDHMREQTTTVYARHSRLPDGSWFNSGALAA
jgi:hypothetical protein